MYNIGLVSYRQSSYKDAMEQFDLAIIEYEVARGDYHLVVADARFNIATMQLEIEKLHDALNNFFQALAVFQMVYWNDHSKVA